MQSLTLWHDGPALEEDKTLALLTSLHTLSSPTQASGRSPSSQSFRVNIDNILYVYYEVYMYFERACILQVRKSFLFVEIGSVVVCKLATSRIR